MSADNRAAQAARAKAMLKKRQAKKAAEAGADSPGSRVASPAPHIASPSLASAKEESNVADLFANGPSANGADTSDSWLSGLARVDSGPPPPAVVSPAPRYAAHPPLPAAISPLATTSDREDAIVREKQQVIDTLEAEKASLTASLDGLSQIETKSEHIEKLLQAERAKTQELETSVRRFQKNAAQLSDQVQREKEAFSSLEAERSALNGSILNLKVALAKARETEEKLQTERENTMKLQEQVNVLGQSNHELSERVEQQQQTISFLVSEKASLTSAVERLEYTEAELQQSETRLQNELTRSSRLQVRLSQIESEAGSAASTIAALTKSEKQLADKSRDQEREINLLNGTVHDFRTQVTDQQQRVRELEEQIESDDRAERLNETLKNTQDRADGLEFQLSKLQQAHEGLETKRDELTRQLQEKTAAEADWEARHTEVENQHVATREQLSSVNTERDALLAGRIALETEVEKNKTLVTELQQRLAALTSDLASNVRQIKQVQTELKAANARAEDAEQTQKELQAEGMGLMRSLDEMRPRIVELTDEKLLLGEKVEGLAKTIQSRDAVVVQLETSLEELREEIRAVEQERDGLKAALENEREALQKDSTELQQAHSELRIELTTAQQAVVDLQDERTKLRRVANSNIEEIRRLTDNVQTQSTQLFTLRSELSERARAQSESHEFLARAQAEMEALRLELAQKDEELERLRETASAAEPPPHASASAASASQSLDEEMLSALRQQHALELSTAHSQVRTLESTVYTAEAQVHTLQRQVSTLEDQLAQLRPASHGSAHHHPRSRRVEHSDDLRRASFTSSRPAAGLSPPATITAFEGLSPAARHKRKVSLSMLKARIDSEVAASNHHLPRPSSRSSRGPSPSSPAHHHVGLPTVIEPASQPATPPPHAHAPMQRPVFMDESHIFWCHQCQGDLVVL